MQKPEIPKNDDRRVAALEALEILDTGVEEQLDFITKIVKERLQVPIVLISLVDKNRQWFKSKQGISASETARDISFCGHAILNTGIFEISNAIEDSRFQDNPLVLGAPNIRFYAGAPITTVDGYRIGTLCIIDTKARKLNQSEKDELEGFARLVQSNLNKKDLQPHLERILDNAFEGLFEISMEGNFIFVNQFGANLLGYTNDELIGKNLDRIIPKRRYDGSIHKSSKILDHISLNGGSIYTADEDLIKKDGELIHVACHLQPIFKSGKVSTMLMSFVDNFEKDSLKAEVLWQQVQSANLYDARIAELGLQIMLDEATDGIHMIDLQGNLMHCSPSFAEMLGYTLDELKSLNVRDWDAQLSSDEISMALSKLSASPSLFETKHRRKDGRLISVQVHAKMIQIDGKDCIYSSARDITQQKQVQAELSGFKAIIDSTNYAVLSTNLEGIITAWNHSAEKLYGYLAAEIIGESITTLLPPESSEDLLGLIARVEQGELISHYRTNRLSKSGSQIPVMLSLAPIKDADGQAVGISSVAYDMTEQLGLERVIQEMAFHDPLTKLANRRLLEDHIHQAFSVNRRTSNYGAVMYLDLDNFKSLNDAYGHQAGDHLLIEIARRLRSCVREVDTISRIGGDEFAVLIAGLEADEAVAKKYALSIAEKIRVALGEPYKLVIQSQAGDSIVMHHSFASIGVALFSGEKKSQDELLKEADMAMYAAKHAGGNLVHFYNENNDSLLPAENYPLRHSTG